MKKTVMVGIFGMIMAGYAVVGTADNHAGSDNFKSYKPYSITGALLTGSGFPAVGTKFKNPLSPASLTYDKVTGQYRVVVLNPHGQYINLKKNKSGQSYFPISNKEAEKVVAIMKNTVSCKAYLTNWHARPCSVQKLVTKHNIIWLTHTTPDVYAEMRKLDIIPRPKSTKYYTNGSRVYMDVLGVRFVVNGKQIIVKNNLPLTK